MRFLTIGRRLALLGAVLLVAGPLGTRLGLWSFVVGFACFAMSGLCGLVALVLSLVGGTRTRQWKRAGVVLGAAVALLAVPALQLVSAFGAPPIHDITTDTADPPPFVAALPLRVAANAMNPPEYGGAEVAAQQHQAFPDIQPLVMNMPPQQAFERVLDEVREFGWDISAAEPAEGRIEAVDTTLVLRLQGRRRDTPASGGGRHPCGRALHVARRAGRRRHEREADTPSAGGVTRPCLAGRRCRRAGWGRRRVGRGSAPARPSNRAKRVGSTRPETS